MSGQTQKILKDSVLYSGFFLLLSATLFTPFVFFTFWLLPLPFFILFVKQHWKVTSICTLILATIFGFIYPLAVVLVFFAAGIGSVMGRFYRNPSASGTDVLLSGMVTACVSSWLFLMIGEYFFQLMDGIRAMWQQSLAEQQKLNLLQIPDQDLPSVEIILPFLLLIFITLTPFCTFLAGRYGLQKLGFSKKYLPLFHNWRLPRPFFYLYVILVIYLLLFQVEQESSAIQGITLVLQVLFVIQGISFMAFLLNRYQKSKLWLTPVLLMVFVPLLTSILLLLGMLDTSFRIRERILTKK